MPGRTAKLLRSSGGARRRRSSVAVVAQGLCAAEQGGRVDLGALGADVAAAVWRLDAGEAGVPIKGGSGILGVRARV